MSTKITSSSTSSKKSPFIKPPVATILVLGAGGLFGSKLCSLLGRIIPQQQFHNPHLSNNQHYGQGTENKIRIVVAGRRADVVNKYSIFLNERLVKENCKTNSYALEFVPSVVDAFQSESEEFTKSMQEHNPAIIVNATGVRKSNLVNLAKTCVVKHGVHFIDMCDDLESIKMLEEEMKSVKKIENKNSSNLVLCATGISTSPALTGAIVDDVLQRNNTFANVKKMLLEESNKKNESDIGEKDEKKTGNDKQLITPISPKVEIYLTPGMRTHNNDGSFEGQINIEQGVSTTRAIFERIGERFRVIRKGEINFFENYTAFRSCKKMIFPWPLGKRLTSPMGSPDVLMTEKAENLTFFAGLQIPLIHRIVSLLPKFVVESVSKLNCAILGRTFRLAGRFGQDVGGLLVKVETDSQKHATESVMLIATKGAGVNVPILPVATLILKLLQNTPFHSPPSTPNSLLVHELQISQQKSSSSSSSPVVIFTNGIRPNIFIVNNNNSLTLIPEEDRSHLVPTMSEIQQLIDDAMLDITFEQTKSLFQWAIGGTGSRALWEKVHPVVRRFHELQGDDIKMKGRVESPVPPRFIDKLFHTVLRLQHSMKPGTEFDFSLTAEPFHEKWTRKYPTGTMFGEMTAEEIVVGKRKNRREVRVFCEKMFGGLVNLYHIPKVDEKTGFIHFDTQKITALFGLINLPPKLAPSVYAVEGCCPETGNFQFDVESKMPIVGTVIKYKGTIEVK